MSAKERRGLKSLRKRVADGEIVCMQTDKSGKFALMDMDTYVKAGSVHTDKDCRVTWDDVSDNQQHLNGHISMLLKVFKVGESWRHYDRMRETMLNHSMVVCPLYLLFKDHKGWSWKKGTAPPTRPVASGSVGMNLHLSEMVSQVLEPLANSWVGGLETISCEDMLSRFDKLNETNRVWKPSGKGQVLTSELLSLGEMALDLKAEEMGVKESERQRQILGDSDNDKNVIVSDKEITYIVHPSGDKEITCIVHPSGDKEITCIVHPSGDKEITFIVHPKRSPS